MYDAIVIGSRCAGAPTAMLLARRGRRVLVVDRAMFPSDVLSGHTIQPAATARLARWGLLDRVRAPPPAPPSRNAPLSSSAAAEAGAEVRQGFTVKASLVPSIGAGWPSSTTT